MTKRFKKAKKSPRKSIRQKSVTVQDKIKPVSLYSISSSDSTTSATSQSKEESAPLIIANTSPDISEESSSEEYSKDLIANPPIPSLTEDLDYFNNFLDLPDINTIAEDTNSDDIITEKETEYFSKGTQQLVQSPTRTELQYDVKFSSQITSVAASSDDSEDQEPALNSVLLDDLAPAEQANRKTITEIENEQTLNLLDKFFEFNLKDTENTIDEIDLEALAKQRDKELLHQHILKFINDLVQKVIEKAEFHSNESDLRQSLDKRKLLEEIFRLYRKSEEEQNICQLLNSKVTNFYRRRNMYRQIQPEKAKYMAQEKEKYLKTLKKLDNLLAMKRKAEDSVFRTVTQLQSEVQERKQQIQNKILLFEFEVKKYFCRSGSTQLNANIDNLLKIMAKSRQEVSDVRFQMIVKEEAYARLLNKVSRFDDLGSGITLSYYHQIENENISVEKKIEESKGVLKKLHNRFRKCLHYLAHVKEKQRIFKSVIAKQSFDYEKLSNEFTSLRNYFHQLNVKSSQIRKQIRKLDIENGLLHKPALLYDYDKTVEHLSDQRQIVASLRNKLEVVQQKISKLENKLITDNRRFII